jgi:hypothetical protein
MHKLSDMIVFSVSSISGNLIYTPSASSFSNLLPCYVLIFDESGKKEVVEVVTNSSTYLQASSNVSTVFTQPIRGRVVLSAKAMNAMRDALFNAQMVRIHTTPPTPSNGMLAIVNNRLSYAYGGAWVKLERPSHSELTDLTLVSAHTQYASNPLEYHPDPTTTHVIDGDNHDHRYYAAQAIQVSSSHPSSPQVGYIYYNTTDGKLYVYDGSSWRTIQGAPSGIIMMTTGNCPQGWTRVSAFDNLLLKGGSTYVASAGYTTHTHIFSDVVAHTHTINSVVLTSTTNGAHVHADFPYHPSFSSSHSGLWDDDSDRPYITRYNDPQHITDEGAHSHTVTFPSTTTTSTKYANGTNETNTSVSTEPASNYPKTKTIVFCQKN